jgi:DNA-binding transcriptional LysR family regulator
VEIRQLRYFVAVTEEGTFAAAADRLHIVPAAVSQQIARLERELSVRLFDRSTRHVALTAAGELLLPEVRAALAAGDRIGRIAADIAAGTVGILRLGTSQGMGERLHRLLDHLAAATPALDVRLDAAPLPERLDAVRHGVLDAAFTRILDHAPGLELLPVWTDPLTVALPATHPLAANSVVRIQDLADMPLRLVPREDNPLFYDLIVNACRDAGFDPVLGTTFTDLQNTLATIGSSSPSWTVLYQATADLLPVRRVAFRPLTAPEPVTSLAVRPNPPIPAVRALLDACSRVAT